MDKLNHYQTLIKQYLNHFADLMKSQPRPDEEVILAFDDERMNYILIRHDPYIDYIIIRVAIKAGQIWVEEDKTEDGIGKFLQEQGVPDEDIVLGFQPPELRNLRKPSESMLRVS